MTDYLSEFSAFVNKTLPSPADTPYETPNFIRSKRSSRATTESFQEETHSNANLAPHSSDYHDNAREGRFGSVDPRRFTPTLHASLVSEILNLRRELDSKNNLVENLETTLSAAKTDNESLTTRLAESVKEVRKAKQQVQQMEKGTYEALEDLVKERDLANTTADELRSKFESLQKKTRHQDEDAVRTQSIWESEKERWDNERRQMERRIHVTESRLRTFVDQMAAQQAATEPRTVHVVDVADNSTFKDSGFGNESDTASIVSFSPTKHQRNKSSISVRTANARSSTASRATLISPDLYVKPVVGNSLADELGIDEEDESDMDDFENGDEELEYPEHVKRAESRQSELQGEVDAKAKRVLGITTDVPESPTIGEMARKSLLPSPISRESQQQPSTSIAPDVKELPRVVYVDKGYQPSPPPSPELAATKDSIVDEVILPSLQDTAVASAARDSLPPQDRSLTSPGERNGSPISPPQTPVVGGPVWPSGDAPATISPAYVTASTQTETVQQTPTTSSPRARDSLSPPLFVPSITIHPPSSRPSTPRASVLPPGTRNASTQADLAWPSRDASVQTEEIRVDRRTVKLPAHLLPSHLLPSPTLPEPRRSRGSLGPALTEIVTKLPLSDEPRSPPIVQSPPQSSPDLPRSNNNSAKDLRSLPLKAIPLPRPVLSPISAPTVSAPEKTIGNGPLNRSSQYGVVQPRRDISYLVDAHDSSDGSDYEEMAFDADPKIFASSSNAFLSRPPQGRFGLSEPPKAVPEHKEISPDRRPRTADSYVGAPAPSVASARANPRVNNYSRPSQKPRASRELRSRSPSFGSLGSSNNSTNPLSQYPPYPIPTRSSSRAVSKPHSEGSRSPTHDHARRSSRAGKASLRKVQSAAAMRNKSGRTSPSKPVRRRRRSPDLTPVVSMAFDDIPAPTRFPIPDLPTPLQERTAMHSNNDSLDMGKASTVSSVPQHSEETSLVDAIAATMVGEWMWKYIRKRKSFGIGEDTSKFPVDQNGVVDVTGHGIRHKRWVWLSPYERTIMWDTKQPTTGMALLGKKGRKLAIQSVLEVKDLTPVPKDAELKSAFHRSILILTPARALKFTATTPERHHLWMTALSFLAQSGQLPTHLSPVPYATHIPVPSVPSVDSVPVKRHRSPSFGRGTVRDSIRLAKGKRPDQYLQNNSSRDMLPPENAENESADAPSIPRLYISTTRHNRKRSNTSPRGAHNLNNLRSFSSSVVPSSASSALHPDQPSSTHVSSSSSRTAVATGTGNTSPTSPVLPMPNFFEAVSTMRMEAFVDPNVRDGVLYVPAPPPGTSTSSASASASAAGPVIPRAHHHHLRGDSTLSQTTLDRRRAGYVFDEDGLDPFKGF